MEEVQIEYWKTDIWEVNEFNFLNEEYEEFSNRWSPNLVDVRSPSYLKLETLQYGSLMRHLFKNIVGSFVSDFFIKLRKSRRFYF